MYYLYPPAWYKRLISNPFMITLFSYNRLHVLLISNTNNKFIITYNWSLVRKLLRFSWVSV